MKIIIELHQIRKVVDEILVRRYRKLFKMEHVKTVHYIQELRAMVKNVDRTNVMKDKSWMKMGNVAIVMIISEQILLAERNVFLINAMKDNN